MLNDTGNRLNQAKTIAVQSRYTTYSETIGGRDLNDVYRFKVKQHSHFALRLSNLKSNADVELIHDRNRNGRIEQGEVVASSRASSRHTESIDIQGLDAGPYFVRVFSKRGRTSYHLTLGAERTRQTSFAYQVVQRTNAIRAANGLPALTWNTQLAKTAQSYAESMARQDFFSHTGANGSEWDERIQAAGYRYSSAAENLSIGRSNPTAVVQAWMNSPGHRRNMLAEEVQEIGVGYFFLKNDRGDIISNHYWAESFGTPADAPGQPTGFNPTTPSNNIQEYLDRISR